MRKFTQIWSILLTFLVAGMSFASPEPSNTFRIGDGSASNKSILFNKGGSNPVLRYSNSLGAFQYSVDGSTFKQMGLVTDLNGGSATGAVLSSGGVVSIGTLSTTYGGLGGNFSSSTGALSIASGTVSAGITTAANGGTGTVAENALRNVGIAVSVATNALTIALKQADGSTDCASTAPCIIPIRANTAASSQMLERSVTSALSMTVPSGTTLGTASGGVYYMYVYALDNTSGGGGIELALSVGTAFDQGTPQSTTAVSGGSSLTAMYSTTLRSQKPVRLIGRFFITETTAGTWASGPTEISNWPFAAPIFPTLQIKTAGTSTYTTPTGAKYLKIRLVGGGGGGGGSGTTGGNGGAGGNSTFSVHSGAAILTANGGAGGNGSGATDAGGTGGSASGGNEVNVSGINGGGSGWYTSANATSGGAGGSNPLGVGAASVPALAGAAATGYGGGGAGGGGNGTAGVIAGTGGGGGGYVEHFLINPSASYDYVVGAAGTTGAAGTSGLAGGAATPGILIVEEYYQ